MHPFLQGLLGFRRSQLVGLRVRVELCSVCGFDLLRAQASTAAGREVTCAKRFAVLRHLVTLLFRENRGLERLRQIVAQRSGASRVDMPTPQEPDIVQFEEADIYTRSRVMLAAGCRCQQRRFADENPRLGSYHVSTLTQQ